jgi:hypothetical protein
MEEQQKKKALVAAAKKRTSTCCLKTFCGGRKSRTLVCHNDKLSVLASLHFHVSEWCHTTLCLPGMTWIEATFCQHFWWSNLQEDICKLCGQCDTCQKTKRSQSKYGLLPEKEAEAES